MSADTRDLLDTLRRELSFLESGGYAFAQSQDPAWRPPFYFEDSPSCFYKWCGSEGERSCGECVLMQLVPDKKRGEAYPCRHIPLSAGGATLEDFYKHGTQAELERNLKRWLLTKIEKMENELGVAMCKCC